jgi:hypothetical protein
MKRWMQSGATWKENSPQHMSGERVKELQREMRLAWRKAVQDGSSATRPMSASALGKRYVWGVGSL